MDRYVKKELIEMDKGYFNIAKERMSINTLREY